MSRNLGRVLAVLGSLVLLLSVSSSALATAEADPFQNTWMRTDKAVNDLVVDRTWIWGPMETSLSVTEPYVEGHDGEREVIYFEKSRMEITDWTGDRSSPWMVTNGLLVVELMSGRLQLGHAVFEQRDAAHINVAGDQNDPNGPTYATLAPLRSAAPHAAGSTIIKRLQRDGNITDDPAMARYNVTTAHRVTVDHIDHRIASVFWDFMNSSGTVWEEGQGFVHGRIFFDAFYGVGLPITEAYWTTVLVNGAEQDVLLQCFERRCLTYTPGNAPGWRVEAGNVGQHYYFWRYGERLEKELVHIHMVAMDDDGQSGMRIGCGDSLIPVWVEIGKTPDVEKKIERALERLFAVGDPFYGESGLYNGLFQSDLAVESVSLSRGVATVHLSGALISAGTCDDPRIQQQIVQTILQFDGVVDTVVYVDGGQYYPMLPQP
jgi:hypothetical protein